MYTVIMLDGTQEEGILKTLEELIVLPDGYILTFKQEVYSVVRSYINLNTNSNIIKIKQLVKT